MSRWIRPRACRIAQSAGDAPDDRDRFGDSERSVALNVLVEVPTSDVLQHKVVSSLVDAAIEDRDDIGMLQGLGTPSLAKEPLEQRGVAGKGPDQDLEGNLMAGLDMDGSIDRAHSPLPSGSRMR